MSFHSAEQARCTGSEGSVALVIEPKEKDLGEFTVRRVLPARERRMVGPFVFFDHMGPAEFPPGQGIQVRPHPHIGLATITYLFEGEILHRDSLGFVQPIRAGAVNLMTAGRGIVHSERAGDDLDRVSRLHGIQSWMALPVSHEECEPAFVHHPASDLPQVDREGASIRVIIGDVFERRSPVSVSSPMLYLDCALSSGAGVTLPDTYSELAIYPVSGGIEIDGRSYGPGVMAVACPGKTMRLTARADSRVMVIGGEPVGERHVWWNFVASSLERIEEAKRRWSEGLFDSVAGDDERIPLPE